MYAVSFLVLIAPVLGTGYRVANEGPSGPGAQGPSPPFFGLTERTQGGAPVITWIASVLREEKQPNGKPRSVVALSLFVDVLHDGDTVKKIDGTVIQPSASLKLAAKERMANLVSTDGKELYPHWARMFKGDVCVVTLKRKKQPLPSRADVKVGLPPEFGDTALHDEQTVLVRRRVSVRDLQIAISLQPYPLKKGEIEIETVDGKRVKFDDFAIEAARLGVPVLFPPYGEQLDQRWRRMFLPTTYIAEKFGDRGKVQ